MKQHSNKLKHHYSRTNFGSVGGMGAGFSQNKTFNKNDT